MKEFVVGRPLKFNLIELLKLQLKLFLPHKISDTHRAVLAYFYIYPDPINRLISDRYFKNKPSADNYVSQLRKDKLLVGYGKDTKVNTSIHLHTESFKVTMTILRDDDQL